MTANLASQYGDADDNAVITVRFPGALAILEATWTTWAAGLPTGPIAYGTQGTLVVNSRKNAEGKAVSHRDLKISVGTNPWEYFTLSSRFSMAVKQVQVWVRVFDGATGQAWFDNVCLEKMPENSALKPFDAKHARVTIDAAKPGSTINYRVWAGVDVSYASFLWRDDVREAVALAAKAGIELMRMHEISNGLDIYPRDDANGRPVYDWTKFDSVFDMLVKTNGMIPSISLESTPPALDRPGTRTAGWRNSTAPKDSVKWGASIPGRCSIK
jgi:hypothetical protein